MGDHRLFYPLSQVRNMAEVGLFYTIWRGLDPDHLGFLHVARRLRVLVMENMFYATG